MRAKNLALLLAGVVSMASLNCAHMQKSRMEQAPGLDYIDIRDRTRVKEFFPYMWNYMLDFNVDVSGDGKRIHVYLKNQKRPDDTPSFECKKEKERIETLIVGDVNNDNKEDILFIVEEYDSKSSHLYSPLWGKFRNIEPWDWKNKYNRIKDLELFRELGAQVMINKGDGTFNKAVPLKNIELPEIEGIPEMPTNYDPNAIA